MSTTLNPVDVVDALVKAVRVLVNNQSVQVDAVSDKDVNADGSFIVSGNATVLVFWGGEQLSDLQDNQAKQYESVQPIEILCGARNMRGTADERGDALSLVAAARGIAGTRLDIGNGTVLPPIKLISVEPFQFSKEGTWYAVGIAVSGFPQFA